MALEQIVRPFVGQNTAPTPFHPGGANSVAPVRIVVGLVGGNKTFSYSQSVTLTSYMAAVHKEAPSSAFNMSTGKLT